MYKFSSAPRCRRSRFYTPSACRSTPSNPRPAGRRQSPGSGSLDHQPAGCQQEHLVAWLFGAFALLALALAQCGLTASFRIPSRSAPTNSAFASPWARNARTSCESFSSTAVSVGGGYHARVLLTLALNQLLARWAQGSSRDPLVLLAVTVLLSLVSALASFRPRKECRKDRPHDRAALRIAGMLRFCDPGPESERKRRRSGGTCCLPSRVADDPRVQNAKNDTALSLIPHGG